MPNPTSIVIFEDDVSQSLTFKPLTYTRSAAELRSGAFSLIERIHYALDPAELIVETAPHLEGVIRERYSYVKINTKPMQSSVRRINARSSATLSEIHNENHSALFTSVWDMVHKNPATIEGDIAWLGKNGPQFFAYDPRKFSGVYTLYAENIFTGEGASIAPTVMLDATNGSILIGSNAVIQPHSTIIGPCIIGHDALIKVGSKIFGGTTIGPVSKVGGEVENAIIQGYSNKQHDGYLGHSFIGEWCNLGAGTNTSDLRNDYGNVSVKIENTNIDTGSMFVGLMMGDHSKSAIGTQFNTGTAIGVHCNVFGAGFPPKWIQNFSWGSADKMIRHALDKALAVGETVKQRRKQSLTETERILFEKLFAERV
jgi:UDP-N-acetylglucosamine diphosphorylase / glucose-1-phosphate thymidylyltransferase / UDP-N-acetylgalactosamine diphosphorylase / glucosamine-1-phosphate N-acetyltransferase / galactosamine-1-phosphate N-acetyltransferase